MLYYNKDANGLGHRESAVTCRTPGTQMPSSPSRTRISPRVHPPSISSSSRVPMMDAASVVGLSVGTETRTRGTSPASTPVDFAEKASRRSGVDFRIISLVVDGVCRLAKPKSLDDANLLMDEGRRHPRLWLVLATEMTAPARRGMSVAWRHPATAKWHTPSGKR